MTATTSATASYLSAVEDALGAALIAEREVIALAGETVARCFDADGILYVFGSGHSHVFAEEAFFRAGGPVRVCPVLKPEYMLHVSAQRSTELERQHGHAPAVLEGYDLVAGRDTMLVVSNSGANPLPVEVARTAKDRGLTVLAITSREYAAASRQDGPRLHEVADIVLDNHCPPGDALVELASGLPRVGPGSSVVGLTLLHAVLVEAMARQVDRGGRPDIYLSAGMPGADEHNALLAERFGRRIPHI